MCRKMNIMIKMISRLIIILMPSIALLASEIGNNKPLEPTNIPPEVKPSLEQSGSNSPPQKWAGRGGSERESDRGGRFVEPTKVPADAKPLFGRRGSYYLPGKSKESGKYYSALTGRRTSATDLDYLLDLPEIHKKSTGKN